MKNGNQKALEKTHGEREPEQMARGPRRKLDRGRESWHHEDHKVRTVSLCLLTIGKADIREELI